MAAEPPELGAIDHAKVILGVFAAGWAPSLLAALVDWWFGGWMAAAVAGVVVLIPLQMFGIWYFEIAGPSWIEKVVCSVIFVGLLLALSVAVLRADLLNIERDKPSGVPASGLTKDSL